MADRSQHLEQIMENQTRFDLNAAIENWRNELAAQPNLASDDRRELETHLRDAIAGFRQRGLNDEESFWLARKRVGQPQPLAEEFVKADHAKVWRERVFWILLAYLVIQLWGETVGCVVQMSVRSIGQSWSSFFIYCFGFILRFLPLVVCATLLANGKSISYFQTRFSYFKTRRRLAVGGTVWALFNISLYFVLGIQSLHIVENPSMHQTLFMNLLSRVLEMAVVAMVLIALLVWLMPTQNQKTPKRA